MTDASTENKSTPWFHPYIPIHKNTDLKKYVWGETQDVDVLQHHTGNMSDAANKLLKISRTAAERRNMWKQEDGSC